jgi:aspartate racemase
MKTIGLLGGITCESSLVYYKLINEMAREKLGGHHSAKSVMVSVDFAEIKPLTEGGEWDKVLEILLRAAGDIERGGADFLVLCANTAHKLAAEIGTRINIPILHIVDVTAVEIKKSGFNKVGLLGTRFTMEEDFFSGRLREKFAIEAITPVREDRLRVHGIIFDELALGIIAPASREVLWRIINDLVQKGAQGIVLGCTELPLLITQDQGNIPLIDTTVSHARAAVDYALGTQA